MYKAKDGKRFGSIFAGRKYDEAHTEDGLHSESPEHEAKETPEFEAGEQEGKVEAKKEGEGEEHEGEEHPVVKEHGPAHKVVIGHDHESGRHTVTSHHKDGHTHTVVHEHAHKAHDEARALAAIPKEGKGEGEEKDSPFHSGKAQQSPASEEDGFEMPELS
jgi:hypothetical protein